MIKKRFGKNDLIFIGALIVLGIMLLFLSRYVLAKDGAMAEVTIDGEVYGNYSLEEDQIVEIKIDGIVTNKLEIKDGYANMIDADCPDHLCVHQKAISKNGETIVCLPNKVVVKITGTKQKSDFDSIAG